MIEALHYTKLKDRSVQCNLCPRNCTLKEGGRGFCGVRKNRLGKLYSLVYNSPCSVTIDPIEKKPLYHFLPGEKAFSLGTVGCNMNCLHCQNWTISRAKPEDFPQDITSPGKIVDLAIKNSCKSIAYTYTEPTVFYEYVLDIAKTARKAKIKNIMVTNGYINEKPLKELYKYIDAANVDLKGFSEAFYKEECSAELQPVLNTLKLLKKMNVLFEITNLIIPTLNDDMKEIEDMCMWIKKNLGTDYPLHFTAFYPCYKRMELPPTKTETLFEAKKIADKAGLNFVYVGNVMAGEANNTYCPKCRKLLIERAGFSMLQNNIINGKCPCGEKIPGVWK